MKKNCRNQKGFTMIELMIVVIIVAILAAAAVPLYRANIRRAIKAEAEATLGSIRTAERIYKAQHDTYTDATSAEVESMLGVQVLDPQYFDADCYQVVNATATAFEAQCVVNNTDAAPGAATAKRYLGAGTVVSMDQNGTLSE
ncbi:MAG TPA: prepilin-type N-terminal cleavage/methylation domain-containing protein [bacterium]|nr:prepilin-type N-terminal cleavage/methylation domain-containing protein [bacterium]